MSGRLFDLEDEIFKNVDADPKDNVPFLLDMIKEKVGASDSEARNMLLYSQQSVIRSLHFKIGELLQLKKERKSAFVDVENLKKTVEIPVKDVIHLENALHDVAENSLQPLNVNPLIFLQPNSDGTPNYTAIEPSTMQQVLIVAPTETTPVLKGPITLKNPQLTAACPINSGIDTQNPNAQETRGAGLDEKDLDVIAKKYMIPIPASDESSKLEELEAFAKEFRTRRIRLGYTQNDVGLSLGKIYSSDFSQTTVSRFEALNLSFKNMVSLKPFMEKWIDDAERHKTLIEQDASNLTVEDQKTLDIFTNSTDNMGHRKRKRRTFIDVRTRIALEQYYQDKPHPSNEEMNAIAETLNQDRSTVRFWFGNRRQKERKMSAIAAPTASFAALPQMEGPSTSHQGVVGMGVGLIESFDSKLSSANNVSAGISQQVMFQPSQSSAFVPHTFNVSKF